MIVNNYRNEEINCINLKEISYAWGINSYG